MSESAVVVFDPLGTEPEGEILSGNRIAVARSRGAVLLPIDVQLLRSGALGGYAKRAYGRGWSYDRHRPGRGCPMVLFASPAYPLIHWAVRLAQDPEGGRLEGHLRVAVDTAQAGARASGLTTDAGPLNVPTLGDPDEHGGWTWMGESKVTIPGEGLLGLQLFGALGGARVAWWAVSQG